LTLFQNDHNHGGNLASLSDVTALQIKPFEAHFTLLPGIGGEAGG
jgi:hypothetical protein